MFYGILLGKADAIFNQIHSPLLVTHLRNERSSKTPHPCPSFLTYKMESLDYMISEVTPTSKMRVGGIYRVWDRDTTLPSSEPAPNWETSYSKYPVTQRVI